MRNDVRPYFVPSDESVAWGEWTLVDGEGHLPLPGYVEGWEPGTNLRIRRDIAIDRERFESETQCALEHCHVYLAWLSSTTGMVASARPARISGAGRGTIDVELIGERIAGTLSLFSRIVFASRPAGEAPIGAARFPGSILAEDRQLLTLEQPSPMFPTQMVDFARTYHSADASWHLDIEGDLESPFIGAVLLQINSRDTALREAISRSGPIDDVQRILIDELESGVSALLIDVAIANRDELTGKDWPIGSVGDVLKNTLLRANLADTMTPSPRELNDFRTQIAGAVRKMGHGRLFR
ncbi:hypothetical protein V4U86_19070 [Mycobacterium sp. AMU20-3851]|uniref:hypothetical protein n=1 Tax=Mycobacterium sp. AMU20-3851 TaxID=3122055 RepID=UPI003754C878